MGGRGRSVSAIILVGVGAYAALVGLMYAFQDRLLFQPNVPTRVLQADPSDIGLGFERIQVASEDGIQLSAWYVPAAEGATTLLFAHGNAGNISHRLQTVQMFHEMGLAVLIFDYRGYGESQGNPSETGTYRDAFAMWNYLVEERGVDPTGIVVAGRSLGGAVAAWLAAEVDPGALILESTFTSVPALAAEVYPLLPSRLLNRFEYDTERYLAAVACPVLIIHGREDEITPFEHGRKLFSVAPQPKEFVELEGGHNDAYVRSGVRYREAIVAFLAQHLEAYQRPVALRDHVRQSRPLLASGVNGGLTRQQ
jgi:hypothetical protein